MKTVPAISETEWKIMVIVWRRKAASAKVVVEDLLAIDKTWHPKTAKALLNRLIKKRALGFRKKGRAYIYRPLVSQDDCVDAESKSFLDQVFGGTLKPMLAHFLEKKKLSKNEINELKALLEKSEKSG
jgi:BlaI family penicillinase repressor